MKKFYVLVLIILSLSFTNAFAISKQGAEKARKTIKEVVVDSCDLIVLKNGDEIYAKVLEINSSEIKYKKCSNLSGPIYSQDKSDVLFVKYSNGQKEIFSDVKKKKIKENEDLSMGGLFFTNYYQGKNKISKGKFRTLLKSYYKSKDYLTNYDIIAVIASINYFFGLLTFLFVDMLLGAIIYTVGLIFGLIASNVLNKAINAYNEHLNNE